MMMYFKALRINFKYVGTAERIRDFSTLCVVVILLFSSAGFAQHQMYYLKQEAIQCLALVIRRMLALFQFLLLFLYFFSIIF